MGEIASGEFFLDFLVALGVGALIGIEREHRRDQTQVIAGVRTFPLFSMAGYLLVVVAGEMSDGAGALLAVGLGGIIAVAIAFLWVRHQLGVTGMTTPLAMIVTFLLGLLVGFGYTTEAIVVGVATTFLLLTKERLHAFAEVLTEEEMMGALQFITVAFILFPIVSRLESPVLGQDWIGRGELVDPFLTLLVVIFVSAISFASFLAMRFVGARRGVMLSGLLGGLVSSEATVVSLAEHARESPDLVRPAVTGAILATSSMFARNLAIAAFADPTLRVARTMLVVLLPMALVTAGYSLWRWRVARLAPKGEARAPRVKNPFAVTPALRFAAYFVAITVLATFASRALGPVGVYATALGGFVSAGAVIASVVSLYAAGTVSFEVATITGALACVIAVANKLVILRWANHAVFEKARAPFAVVTLLGLAALAGLVLALA